MERRFSFAIDNLVFTSPTTHLINLLLILYKNGVRDRKNK
jgi:hypothetical protein